MKVISNYFHMTFLQLLSSFFYVLIYPFVIKAVGISNYGLYVVAMSVSAYFAVFVNFGFDMHAARLVSLDQEDDSLHSDLLSRILAAKIVLALISIIVFAFLVTGIPFLRSNWIVFTVCFGSTVSCIFLPSWYYHGLQKMKILTATQLFFKVLSLVPIYVLVRDANDVNLYASITTVTNISSSAVAFLIAKKMIRSKLHCASYRSIIEVLREVQPFFWSTAANTVKQKSVEIIIGSLFGMKDVAIYDLANKIFSIPSLLASNINAALFPKIVKNPDSTTIGKIIKIELLLGVAAIMMVMLSAQWIIDFISDDVAMQDAYYLAVILSFNVLTYLIVGSYINFIFIPKERYELVFRNQLVSLVSFYIFCYVYVYIAFSVYSIVLSLVSAALIEIFYSHYLVSKIRDD